MSILIKEYLGSEINSSEKSNFVDLKESASLHNTISENSIMVDIEGIHVGPTRNFTWYTEEALKSSISSWNKPYNRPLILHHNEKDGKIIGRVLAVKYTDVNTRSKTGALVFTCNVSDSEGKEGVKDGRLATTSIGVIAHDVRCSICGNNIAENGECEHERGEVYDKQVCYWKIYSMEAKELSYVIVPSDVYAHNVKVYSPTNSKFLKEEVEEKVSKTLDLKEGAEKDPVIEEVVKEEKEVKEPEVKVEKEEKEEKEEEVSEKTLMDKILELEQELVKLKAEVKASEKKVKDAEQLKENAETELMNVSMQLKEMSLEHLFMLREKLNRPALLIENLMIRSQDSIMDSIFDLKEELGANTIIELKEENTEKSEKIELTESSKEVTESVKDTIKNIEKVESDVLVDENKDSTVNLSENDEKKSSLNIKESQLDSNSNNEAIINMAKNYFDL